MSCSLLPPAVASLLVLGFGCATKHDAEQDARIAELSERVAAMEGDQRQAAATDSLVEAARIKAKARMLQDRETHTADELRQVEELYQVANQNWGAVAAVAAMEKLTRDHQDFNRTGCAVLYLGQLSEGDDRIQYLQRAADEHADSYYGDGVNVGAYANFLLGSHHHELGDHEGETVYFDAVPVDAVDHSGHGLAERIGELHR